jgi:ribosomal protein S18 acetylase RimI-like enzyme
MTARTANTSSIRRLALGRSATIKRLRDVESVRAHLERSRAYTAYALAYLDKRLFPMADFYEAVSGERTALVMHGRGGLGPSTLTMGDTALVGQLLSLHPGPRQAFVTCEPEHVDTVLVTHNVWRPQTMLRMQLERADFVPPPERPTVRRLSEADAFELNRLYNEESARYTGRQIVEGVYFGAFHRGWLIAAAGTHIYSKREGVAVIGNVFTHQDFRGRGLGTAVTAAVAAHLLQSCDLIVLNVDPANRTARHIYEQLGFHETGRLVEAMATRRHSYSPLPTLRRALARYRATTPNTEVVSLP